MRDKRAPPPKELYRKHADGAANPLSLRERARVRVPQNPLYPPTHTVIPAKAGIHTTQLTPSPNIHNSNHHPPLRPQSPML